MTTFLYGIFPYICFALFVVGLLWRYRYDKFGWTTRSSQLYESRLLRIGSPLFHFGLLIALVGHVMGLIIPNTWTLAMGISQEMYHLFAVSGGIVSGAMIVVGFTILVYRRRTVSTVFNATTINDKVMYLVLGLTIVFGMWNTISTTIDHHYDYREGVSIWYRSLFALNPQPELMGQAPIQFQLHAIVASLLFAIWPFTRLVHVFSAPISYLNRPYIIYRSAGDARPVGTVSRAPRRTWDRPELTKRG
ncbi:respiratory nitrate reductase subunit gamma [Nigerium sp.]|uniref:respiratory nitrate reductase subunit gamma n=1 Tax=Nigerium sp. TaxID=2042655 RepID=UPI003221682F